jgi:hypothetical protein
MRMRLKQATCPLTGPLIKPIHLGEAKPRGLHASFALPPDESDIKAHWGREVITLRKAYSEAKKLRRQNFLFEMEICGPAAIIPANGIDRIQAAIDLHSLKV